jgi:hypothetical protein
MEPEIEKLLREFQVNLLATEEHGNYFQIIITAETQRTQRKTT